MPGTPLSWNIPKASSVGSVDQYLPCKLHGLSEGTPALGQHTHRHGMGEGNNGCVEGDNSRAMRQQEVSSVPDR